MKPVTTMEEPASIETDRAHAWRNIAIYLIVVACASIGLMWWAGDETHEQRAAKLQAAGAELERQNAIDVARAGVLLALRDPSSALFRDVAYRSSSKGKTVCGLVNAKNGFGGYSGFAPFYAVGARAELRPADLLQRDVFDLEYEIRCGSRP